MKAKRGPVGRKIVPAYFFTPRPKPDTPDLIMTLPPELRNRIWLMLLLEEGPREEYNLGKEPPLLRTSKAIRAETSPVWYGNHNFRAVSRDTTSKLPAIVQKLRSVVLRCGPRPFMHILLCLYKFDTTAHVALLLPLIDLMRELEFEPDRHWVPGALPLSKKERDRSNRSGANLVHGMGSSDRIIGRAITLGRRARDEKWSKSRLEQRFATFVEIAKKKNKKWPAYL